MAAAEAASRLRAAIGAAFVLALLVAGRALDLHTVLGDTLDRIAGLGPLAPVGFVAVYVLATVLFVPGAILTLGAGAVFGVVRGSILVSMAATLGATLAFLAGRYLARDWVARKIATNARFRAVDEAIARDGWKIVGLMRLSPVFPFNLLNYALGITRVSLRDYFFASWIGMMPGTVMYVYIGSLAGSLATIGAGGRGRSPAEWVLYALGFAATVTVTILVTRIARAALERTNLNPGSA